MQVLNSAEDLIDGQPLYVSDHLTFAIDDKREPVVCDFADPERHFHVTEAERVLLSCFTSSNAYSGRSRSGFRGDVDHDSGLKPIRVPG
jgi:hypothetical protein